MRTWLRVAKVKKAAKGSLVPAKPVTLSIEKVIYHLLQNEPFFAHFLLASQISYDILDVETAGARVTDVGVQFAINSQWFFNLPFNEQLDVLKHEILHVLFNHTGERGGGLKADNKMARNVAMDCAINQYLQHLGKDSVSLPSLEKIVGKKLRPFDCWEYYYECIKEAAEKGKIPYEPEHDFMESNSSGAPGDKQPTPEQQAAMKAYKQAVVKDLANKAVQMSAGNIPENLVGVIAAMNKASQVNWKQQLRNIVSSARSVQTKNTRLKPNRRYELEQPGRKKKRELVLGVCTDSSGSVSDQAYTAFLNEIHTIAKRTTITYLVHADCVVQKVDVIKGGKAKGDVLKKRHGAGGTAYQPAIDECMKRQCDAIIYFGDMDAADPPRDPGVPFIWCRVGSSKPPGDFGRIVDINETT